MNHYCVLDTTAILQRYQPDSQKEKNFIDALCQNDNIGLFVPIACISEAIQQFFKAYKNGKITIKERTELINRVRKDIKDKILFEHSANDSLFQKTKKIFSKSFFVPRRDEHKGFIDIADMLVIATALDLKKGQKTNEEFCIVTSDLHLFDTASGLGIQCYNSEIDDIDKMPKEFCRRKHKRKDGKLKVTSKECEKPFLPLGVTETVNVCQKGLCIKKRDLRIRKSDVLNLAISTYDKEPRVIYKGNGMIMWIGKNKMDEEIAGVETENPTEMRSIPF
ncbi:MAG: PIN domain-containing protein [Candidatus Omnitrophota bacterium]